MWVSLDISGRRYAFDEAMGRSIAIPVRFHGLQPNLLGVAAATAEPLEQGGFRGDTRQGGICNVMKWSLIPHCHGTHTETVSHIVDDEIPVTGCVGSGFIPTVLVSVLPVRLGDAADDSYPHPGHADDWVITVQDIERCLQALDDFPADAIVIRTLPNTPGKRFAHYDREPVPAYFSIEAMQHLGRSRIRHLLVDLPSVDRVFDGGQLRNHRCYWQVPADSRRVLKTTRTDRTITEFCFVPDDVGDGPYLLDLQLPDLGVDAAPSRPLLWPLSEQESR